jgi:hypothetical protein
LHDAQKLAGPNFRVDPNHPNASVGTASLGYLFDHDMLSTKVSPFGAWRKMLVDTLSRTACVTGREVRIMLNGWLHTFEAFMPVSYLYVVCGNAGKADNRTAVELPHTRHIVRCIAVAGIGKSMRPERLIKMMPDGWIMKTGGGSEKAGMNVRLKRLKLTHTQILPSMHPTLLWWPTEHTLERFHVLSIGPYNWERHGDFASESVGITQTATFQELKLRHPPLKEESVHYSAEAIHICISFVEWHLFCPLTLPKRAAVEHIGSIGTIANSLELLSLAIANVVVRLLWNPRPFMLGLWIECTRIAHVVELDLVHPVHIRAKLHLCHDESAICILVF